ncbi:MAG: PASTA domain-containing protein [Halopseudomonas sp.]|uniref:PASTA domain-containing protein n=1 Tax=Halopseudomonas sp. TaxID=2901191 RepID=UPI0030012ED9
MQWSISGSVFEADGKAASGQVELQLYDMARQLWRSAAKGSLNAKGDFALKVDLSEGAMLPALRLCETSKAKEPARVLAEGGLIKVEPGKLVRLSYGDIERLGDNAVPRSERDSPFTAADDYLLAGMPREVVKLTLQMASLRINPQVVRAQPQVQPASIQLKAQADLSKQLEVQSLELNQKAQVINTLERDKQNTGNELKQAQLKIQTLEKQLQSKPAAAGNEQIELATNQIKLQLNEQILRQSTEFELSTATLQRNLNQKNLEIAQVSERLEQLSKQRSEAAEEAARAREESERLKEQMHTQVDAGELYSNIARQLQQAQSKLNEDGVPYRLGKVSLNLKTLVNGNSMTLPTLAEIDKGNSGIFTDVALEYLPDSSTGQSSEPMVTVPDFSDLTETLARRLAGDLGLQLEAAYQSVGKNQSIGQAIRQIPAKGSTLPPGESVLVVFTQA